MERDALIENVISLEWDAFDKVTNEGGRADCQDDYHTFHIMRMSQYMTWNDELLESWRQDLLAARDSGNNLITYKYGYMMESTAPEKFAVIKDQMPAVSGEKRALIDQIAAIQVGWMEEFAKEFPGLSANSRFIHTLDDDLYHTSAETYLRGELMTYSDQTLKLYGGLVVDLARNGKNLTRMIMENTVHLYGYQSLEAAERAMA